MFYAFATRNKGEKERKEQRGCSLLSQQDSRYHYYDYEHGMEPENAIIENEMGETRYCCQVQPDSFFANTVFLTALCCSVMIKKIDMTLPFTIYAEIAYFCGNC